MTWSEYFMGLASWIGSRSKDSTKVGAVAVDDSRRILETGYNGPPQGVQDLPERFERPAKYLYAAHAELNLVATAARSRLNGSTVYVTHLCCANCAKALIQAGVKKIVYGPGQTRMPIEEFKAARQMLHEAGVEVEAAE